MSSVSILVVEDELPILKHLKYMIAKLKPDAHIAAYDTFDEAAAYLEHSRVDIAFFDIDLDGRSGFDLLPYLDDQKTWVIMVTANDQMAVRAYEENVKDYLLKPLSEKRLQAALDKWNKQKLFDVDSTGCFKKLEDRILVQRQKESLFIQLKDISYIQSEDNYTLIHDTNSNRYIYKSSLKEWIKVLPPEHFIQIHRSVIIQLSYLKRFSPNDEGSYDVIMDPNNVVLPMSRRYKKALFERFDRPF